MPASVAHMLIAHKALEQLQEKDVPEYSAFADVLDDDSEEINLKAYVNLGSLGPDLFYFSKLAKSARDMLIDGYVQATGHVPWSYHLHARSPHKFPLNLIEIIFRDVVREGTEAVMKDQDRKRLAYVAGHLTHMAADQIIHPIVNEIAGPYYRSGDNRRRHRECEVYQDYFLYSDVYRLEGKSGGKYDFFEQDFGRWADCIRGWTFTNTRDWFRYFIQRGFVETYGVSPDTDEVEDAVDNLLLTLRASSHYGPYRKAAEDYEKGDDSELYRRYVTDVNYVRYYRMAVELAVIYLIALYEMYAKLREGRDLTEKHRDRFLDIVSDADLSSPLQKNILDDAEQALEKSRLMDAFVEELEAQSLDGVGLVAESDVLDEGKSDEEVIRS